MGPKSFDALCFNLVLLLFALSDASNINVIFSASPQELHPNSTDTSVQLTCTAIWSSDLGGVWINLYEHNDRIEDERTYFNSTFVKITATIDVSASTCYKCELHSFALDMAHIEQACVSMTNESSLPTNGSDGQSSTPTVTSTISPTSSIEPSSTQMISTQSTLTPSPPPTTELNSLFRVTSKSADFIITLESSQPADVVFSSFVIVSAESHILLDDLKASYNFHAVGSNRVSVLKYFSQPLSAITITPVNFRTVKVQVNISLSKSLSKSLHKSVDELITWTISIDDVTANVSNTISITVHDHEDMDNRTALIFCYIVLAVSCIIIVAGTTVTVTVLCKMRLELQQLRWTLDSDADTFRYDTNAAKQQTSCRCWPRSWCDELNGRPKLEDEIGLHAMESHDDHVTGESP